MTETAAPGRTMIAAPLAARNWDTLDAWLDQAAAAPVDAIEWRLDALAGDARSTPAIFDGAFAPAALAAWLGKPVLITCRAARQGGGWPAEREDERLALLQRAVDAGFPYVDVEADAIARIVPRAGTILIASWHDFERTPADLIARVQALAAGPGDWVKFAVTARDAADVVRVRDALAACPKPAVGLAMGEAGEASRILAARFGSRITFGALAAGQESAPGQPAAADLDHLYNARAVTRATRLFAVVGNPVGHSQSPAWHNARYRAAGLDAVYVKFPVEDMAAFLREVAAPLGIEGLSVTVPHKEAALALADDATPAARAAGAANTLTRRADGGWSADNTDVLIADVIVARAAEAGVALAGRKALVLGAGGTARALAWGLKRHGLRPVFANRTRARAERLAADFDGGVADWSVADVAGYAVIANATTLGMAPAVEVSPLAGAAIGPGRVVFDAVYTPPATRLLRDAAAGGAATVAGTEMFDAQAAGQYRRWFGAEPSAL